MFIGKRYRSVKPFAYPAIFLFLLCHVLTADNSSGYPFSKLTIPAQKKAGVYDPRSSCNTDNPFGIFAHNELPVFEAMNLIADMGVGYARIPQYNPDKFVELSEKLSIGVVATSHLPKAPALFERIIRKYRNRIAYYQTAGDEPNNNHIDPGMFVKRMEKAAVIFRKAKDPKAKLIMDDLGDSGTAAYLKKCLDKGLANSVDYVSYGYFTWGHARNLYRQVQSMVDEANKRQNKSLKLYLNPLQHFGSGGPGLHKFQKHLIDLYWCGAELITMYKLIDHIGQFSILGYDGSLSSSYAGFQLLCQFIGRDLPPCHDLKIQSRINPDGNRKDPLGLAPPIDWTSRTVENGRGFDEPFERTKLRTWIRPFRNKEKLLIILYYQGQSYNYCRPWSQNQTCTLTIPTSDYRYPVAVDFTTGRLRDLPYKVAGNSITVEQVPLETYAQGVLLLRHHPEWETNTAKQAKPREQKPAEWQTITDMTDMPGDWVTAILPDGKGGAWIGICPMSAGKSAIAYITPNHKVEPIYFTPDKYGKINGCPMVKLLKYRNTIYAAMRGASPRMQGLFFSFPVGAHVIRDYFNPASMNKKEFRTSGFTDMAIRGSELWLTAIGSANEQIPNLGEAVAVFDLKKRKWKASYGHRRPNELAGWGTLKGQWSGRFTKIFVDRAHRVWIAAMVTKAACFDGKDSPLLDVASPKPKWHLLNQVIGALTICSDGSSVWFGNDKGEVYKVTPPEIDDDYDITRFSPAITGLNGRILYSASSHGKVYFATRYNGMAMYDDSATNKWTAWKPGRNGFTTGMVQGILPGKDRVWVYTWGDGISYLATGTGSSNAKWKTIRRQNGLADNRVSTMVNDEKNGRLWVGTFRGISMSTRRSDKPKENRKE